MSTTVREDEPAVGVATAVPGLRRIGRVDAEKVAARLLSSIGDDGDQLHVLLRAVADLVGAPTAVVWRRDERGRLLLARKWGDDALAADAGRHPVADDADDGGAAATGIPLEIHVRDEVQLLTLHARPFAAVALTGGVLALGPLRRERLPRRARSRLAQLAGLIDGALREALRRAQLEAELASLQREVELSRRAVGTTIDEERSLQLLIDLAVSTSGCRGGFAAIRRDGRFRMVATRNLPPGFDTLDVTPGHGILAGIPGLPGLLVVEDPASLAAAGVDGLLAVSGPADAPDPAVIFGLVPDAGGQLPDDCSDLLATLVEQALLVQESSDAARATADRHVLALRGLCHALDARSHATDGHHALVARTAGQLARRLGTDPKLARLVVDAALVHDVGLLAATSEAAMAAEFAHPSLGAEMAALVPGAADLAPLIRTHHEWWDGYGFPAGLTGDAIPIGGRILAAAEFYAEMLQSGDGDDHTALTREIRIRRGTQLDPECADTLVALAEEGS